MATTVRSRKAKGKRLQNKIVELLKEYLGFSDDDVRAVPASVTGEDIILSAKARETFPFSIEAKNTERISIWSAIEQAKSNADENDILVVFSRNHSPIYAVLEFETLLEIVQNLRLTADELRVEQELK